MAHYYAMIGNFTMDQSRPKGITVCDYFPDDGTLKVRDTQHTQHNIGWQTWDADRGILYATDEYWSQPNAVGGGGNVAAYQVDAHSGTLAVTSFCRTFGTNPSYLCLDKQREFLIVVHHTTNQFVTKLIQNPDGGIGTETLHDTCSILLYELEADGRVGKICDVVCVDGEVLGGLYRQPHLHAVVPSPDGKYFVVNDKGLRKIYVYRIDCIEKKLVLCSQLGAPEDGQSRYGVFDRNSGIYYLNFENRPFLCAYSIHPKTGVIKMLNKVPIQVSYAESERPSDITIHPSGRWLYVALRTNNKVVVFSLDGNGGMQQIQEISCGGQGPRGLCVAPDGRYLFAMNAGSKNVFALSVGVDGVLAPKGIVYAGGSPGNMQIIKW